MTNDQLRLAPQPEDSYRLFIVASLGLGVVLGFALGLHTAVSRLIGGGDPERSLVLLQAHGQVQLLGFAGLYVMGMGLRLLPRFAGARLAHTSLLAPIVALVVSGLVLRAVALPFLSGDAYDALFLLTAALVLASALAFALVVCAGQREKRDPSIAAFVLGALFLVVAAAVSLVEAAMAVADGRRFLPLLSQNALLQLEQGGFILLFITGVSFRAIPTMVGLQRPGARHAYALVVLLAAAVGALAASLLYLEHAAYSVTGARVVSLSFACFGLLLVAISWSSGAIRSASNRLRPASQPHLWLVRSAFAWMALTGVLALVSGAISAIDGKIPDQFDFDAVRHGLGLGVITNLIAGMSLMIVPEFAAERQHADQRRLALALCLLINLAAVLRVAPALAGTDWSFDLRNASMVAAGVLAELAIILFAVSLIRLVLKPVAAWRPL
jgi:hypothetical protein